MSTALRIWFPSLALCAAFSSASAQLVRGRIAGADTAHGIAGTIVRLVDSTGRDVARTISDERGGFVLRAPGTGSYALRTLRIGFAPGSFGPYSVPDAGLGDVRLVLHELPLTLGAIRVEGRNECRVRAESGPAALAIWEQAQTALLATLVSRDQRRMTATLVSYLRITDGASDRTTRLTVTRRSGESTRPFGAALKPDDYAVRGYQADAAHGGTLYGPDADVLLSDSFGATHCFRVDPASDRRADEIGLAFEPLPHRRAPVDVAGTLWLGRRDAVLRRLEFQYVGTEYPDEVAPSGRVDFAVLANGLWVIPSWVITAPRVELRTAAGAGSRSEARVLENWRSGGILMTAQADSTVLWRGPGGSVRGQVVENGSGRPVAGATVTLDGTDYGGVTDSAGRFTIDDVLPGEYVASVRSAAADVLGLRPERGKPVAVRDGGAAEAQLRAPAASEALDRACAASLASERRSMLLGTVRDPSGNPAAGATVVAHWLDDVSRVSGGLATQERDATASTGADGTFRICGVVRERPVAVRATFGLLRSDAVEVQLEAGELVGRFELRLQQSPGGTIAGRVHDADGRAVPRARVELLGVREVESDTSGVFEFGGLAPGHYVVRTQPPGYRQALSMVDLQSGKGALVDMQLAPDANGTRVAGRSDTSAKAGGDIPGFARRRSSGQGTFLLEDDIARRHPTVAREIMRAFPGVAVRPDGVVQVVSGRRSESDFLAGTNPCTGAMVFLNGTAVGTDFNIDRIPPQTIHAIELYRTTGATPAEFVTESSGCGTLVIWTR